MTSDETPKEKEHRPITIMARQGAMGRSRELVMCPFCSAEIWTFTWSRCGSGKRCTCGAVLGGREAHK